MYLRDLEKTTKSQELQNMGNLTPDEKWDREMAKAQDLLARCRFGMEAMTPELPPRHYKVEIMGRLRVRVYANGEMTASLWEVAEPLP